MWIRFFQVLWGHPNYIFLFVDFAFLGRGVKGGCPQLIRVRLVAGKSAQVFFEVKFLGTQRTNDLPGPRS